mmetsp:Transcript_75053/g.219879  ORF Transcript_75053/g.219879 Transcript_75053/m.219879 type:complete len:229 (-) Transcript_75053:109-795(-)
MAGTAPSPGAVDLQGGRPAATTAAVGEAEPAGAGKSSHLAAGSSDSAAQEAVLEAGREVVRTAVSAVRQGTNEIHMYIVANPYSVTVLSFIGGLALLITSCISLLNFNLVLQKPLQYILSIYLLMFGLAIAAVDGPGDRLPRVRAKILAHSSFLHNNIHRALFYGFIACQQVSHGSREKEVWRQVVGFYFLFVAVAHGALHFQNCQGASAEPGAPATGPSSPERPTAV